MSKWEVWSILARRLARFVGRGRLKLHRWRCRFYYWIVMMCKEKRAMRKSSRSKEGVVDAGMGDLFLRAGLRLCIQKLPLQNREPKYKVRTGGDCLILTSSPLSFKTPPILAREVPRFNFQIFQKIKKGRNYTRTRSPGSRTPEQKNTLNTIKSG
jgi:hypothetical protein